MRMNPLSRCLFQTQWRYPHWVSSVRMPSQRVTDTYCILSEYRRPRCEGPRLVTHADIITAGVLRHMILSLRPK